VSAYALAVRQHLGLLPKTQGPIATSMTPGKGPGPVEPKQRKRIQLPVVQGEAPSFSLQSIVDQYMYSVDDNQRVAVGFKMGGERSDGVFHASEVSEGVCVRRLAYGVYRAPRAPRQIDPQLRRVFENGHFVHARLESTIIGAVRAQKGEGWNELAYPPDAKLRSGTADVGIVLYGWPYLIEIKSIKKGVPGVSGFLGLGVEPDPKHTSQLNQYMGLAKVHAGFILYECKDNQELREYFVRFDRKLWLETERERIDPALSHVQAGTLPPVITDDEGCTGPQCEYHAICKKRGATKWVPPGPLTLKEIQDAAQDRPAPKLLPVAR